MERKSNITAWQLRLFELLDRDVLVMQRDEQEVFDDALHVFFEKEYYDAYVAKATRYGSHSYAYYEDKLGEVIYQLFDERVTGLTLHMDTRPEEQRSKTNVLLCDEKYLSARDLRAMKSTVENYHYLYRVSIERCSREEAVAFLYPRSVYIIGQLPDLRKKPVKGEKQTFELMTMKRKKDNGEVTGDDYDYESLKVFLTAESAARFNPDHKPVNKYKLSLLSQFVKGRLQIILEPHRGYWMEYDPAAIDISAYFKPPMWNADKVCARVEEYAGMETCYILLGATHCNFGSCEGIPFLLKKDDTHIVMYLFEQYEDAVSYCLENPLLLPAFDGTYPIGVLHRGDEGLSMSSVLNAAAAAGVTGINLDMDTMRAIGCELSFFADKTGVTIEKNKEDQRFTPIPFADTHNDYTVSEERKSELLAHMDNDADEGVGYMSQCTTTEMIVLLLEAGHRFDEAREAGSEEGQRRYNRLMNRMTIPLTEALCEQPFVYTLRDKDGHFIMQNNLAYLITTNRFEAGRKGEGRLIPSGIDNPKFMEQLEEACKVAAITDGPDALCLADVHLMSEAARQQKRTEALRTELMIYLTQGCDLSYVTAWQALRRLRSDNDIYEEFTSAVRDGGFPSVGMLHVNGQTARTLAEENGYNIWQAYDALLSLREHDKEESEAAEPEPESETGTEKKSLFGKLFKK